MRRGRGVDTIGDMELEYRVNLDIYNGPLDLLLYLIRRDEVDIHDIPIARVAKQYIQYVELLQKLDPNLSGEFLVMAATLMEIKSRMLLPGPEIDGEGDEEEAQLVCRRPPRHAPHVCPS